MVPLSPNVPKERANAWLFVHLLPRGGPPTRCSSGTKNTSFTFVPEEHLVGRNNMHGLFKRSIGTPVENS